MPKSCVAVNCTNPNLKYGGKVSFHVFPKIAERSRYLLSNDRMKMAAYGNHLNMPFYVEVILLKVNVLLNVNRELLFRMIYLHFP